MKKTVRASIDRQEGDLLVLIPDEGNAYIYLDARDYPFAVGDIVSLTMEGETVLCADVLREETKERKETAQSRLAALFARGKRNTR